MMMGLTKAEYHEVASFLMTCDESQREELFARLEREGKLERCPEGLRYVFTE